MAFPTTSVLDTLLQTPLSGNWTGPEFDATKLVDTASGARGSSISAFSDAYWNVQDFGPDSEAYVTVATLPAGATDECAMVGVRLNAAGQNGYSLEVDRGGTWKLIRIDTGAQTLLAQLAGTGPSLAAGDSFGLELIGNVLTAYYKASGGSWAAVTPSLTFTDATYTAAGKVLLEAFGNVELLTQFGGGTIVTAGGAAPVFANVRAFQEDADPRVFQPQAFQRPDPIVAYQEFRLEPEGFQQSAFQRPDWIQAFQDGCFADETFQEGPDAFADLVMQGNAFQQDLDYADGWIHLPPPLRVFVSREAQRRSSRW